MNIEDITKAAAECRLTTAQSMGVYGQYHYIDECPNHGLSCDELVEDSFVKGAEWRINSVWHDATEKPDGKRRYLVETHLGKRTHHSVWTKAFTPEEKVEDDGFLVRWAYLEDILPLPNEERRKL